MGQTSWGSGYHTSHRHRHQLPTGHILWEMHASMVSQVWSLLSLGGAGADVDDLRQPVSS